MEQQTHLSRVKESIIKLDFDSVHHTVREAIDAGVDPRSIIVEAMAPAMEVVGKKFETGEYYLSELVVAAAVMKEGMEIITPYIKADSSKRVERLVIASVEGDYHDIGKNIVVTSLEAQGLEVIDLGVDVPASDIVNAVKEHGAVIVGLSALLTLTMAKMGEVITALEDADLRKRVKVIIGGSPVTPQFGEKIGADHTALNAIEGTHKCIEWVSASSQKEVI